MPLISYKKTNTILDQICDNKITELNDTMQKLPLKQLKETINSLESREKTFAQALKKEKLALIAEVKKSSPSAQGQSLRNDFDPAEIAKIYEQHGAAAISVLTDEKFFQGSLKNLELVRAATRLPILRKDFILDPYQLYETKAFGANAILLITAILEKNQLKNLYQLARELNLDVLMEIHDEAEAKIALEIVNQFDNSAKIIGINNRDLKTMKIDLNTFGWLASLLPDNIIKVAESGISTREDAGKMRASGADAILVGTSLVKAKKIGQAVDELIS